MSLIVSKLPDYYYDFKNKKRYPIYRRTPAVLESKLIFKPEDNGVPFPTGDLTNSRDFVFEFTTVNPRAYYVVGAAGAQIVVADPPGFALPGSGTTNPPPAIVMAQLSILDTSSNQPVIEDPVSIDELIDQNTKNWELQRPYYLPTTKEWQVKGSNLHTTTSIQISILLRGAWLHMGLPEDYSGPEM